MATFETDWFDDNYAVRTEWDRSSKQFLRNLVPNGEQLKILDIGCGTGLNARHLSAQGHAVSGVDGSQVAIERFNELGLDGTICDLDEGIPFPDETFDAVFASEVLEHIVDTASALREWNRIIKPGGAMYLSVPNSSFWVYRVYAILGRTLTDVQHPGHVRFFSPRMLEKMLTDAGFQDLKMSGRNIYFIKTIKFLSFLNRPLFLMGAQKEYRVSGEYFVVHLSKYSHSASPFWSDTLLVRCKKL